MSLEAFGVEDLDLVPTAVQVDSAVGQDAVDVEEEGLDPGGSGLH